MCKKEYDYIDILYVGLFVGYIYGYYVIYNIFK